MWISHSLKITVIIAIGLLFGRLGSTTVFQIAEARNTVVPMEMARTGDYIVPHFNGQLRTDKPPLHYYAMLLSYRLGGVSETSARFFSALCGLLVIMATWLVSRKYNGSGWSAVVLLASVHAIMQFRLATPDPYLIVCHVLSLFCFWEGYQQNKPGYFYLMYFLWGLAFLAKGPVAVLLPGLTVIGFLFLQKKCSWNYIARMKPIAGLIILLIVAVPWFVLVHYQTGGEWTRGFFLEHNMARFNDPVDSHGGPFFLPAAFVLAGLFPFAVFLPRALLNSWKIRQPEAWLRFNLLAAVVIIAAYSFSATKLINYTSPSYPFLAILVGALIQQQLQINSLAKRYWPEWIALAVLSIALPIGVYTWMKSDELFRDMASYSWLLLILPVFVMAAVFAYQYNRRQQAFNLLTMGSILMNALIILFLYPLLEQKGSIHQLASIVQTTKPVAAYRSFNEAFVFYHGQPIPVLLSAGDAKQFLEKNPTALLLERNREPTLADSVPGLYVLAKEKDLFSTRYTFIYQQTLTPP